MAEAPTDRGVSHVLDATDASPSAAASLQDVARAAIKERVLLGELPAGTPLSEVVLAQDLNMSRTPVRQALQDLVAQGLLERVPGRGVLVSRIDVRKMLDIIDVQECLLAWCVPRLCDTADVDVAAVAEAYQRQVAGAESGDNRQVLLESRRMDTLLVGLTGNQEMVRYMREISDLLILAAAQVVTSREKLAQAVREHGEIVDALAARDKERAMRAVDAHCAGIRRRFMGLPE